MFKKNVFLILSSFCLMLTLGQLEISAAEGVPDQLDSISEIIRRRFAQLAPELDMTHPAAIAASRIADPEARRNIEAVISHNLELLDVMTGWMIHEVPDPSQVFEIWKKSFTQDRPLMKGGKFLKREVVREDREYEDYKNSPWIQSFLEVGDEYHSVAVKIVRNDAAKETIVDFYDPYEAFSPGSYLEHRVYEVLAFRVHPAEDEKVTVRPHYTKHQSFADWGECGIYSHVYHSLLSEGADPSTMLAEEIKGRVAVVKSEIRAANSEFFSDYDRLFQFVFESGFVVFFSEEVAKLPKTWGTLPEE